jgi:hypothetical protein
MVGRLETVDDGPNGGSTSGRLLMVFVIVLAVLSTLLLVLADSATWLRMGVLAALWAALLAGLLAVRFRKQVGDRENEVADLQSVYELELEREVAARREYELEVEAEARKRIEETSKADLAELRSELRGLRESLERLTGGEVLVERFALRAQSTRMRALAEGKPRVVPSDSRRGMPAVAQPTRRLEPATELMARPGTQSVPGMAPVARRGTQSVPGMGPVARPGTQSVPEMAPVARPGTQSVPGMGPVARPGTQSVPGMAPAAGPQVRRGANQRPGGYRPEPSRPQSPREGAVTSGQDDRREVPAVASLGGQPSARPGGPQPQIPTRMPAQRPVRVPAPQGRQPQSAPPQQQQPLPSQQPRQPPPQPPQPRTGPPAESGWPPLSADASRPGVPRVEPPRTTHAAPPPERVRRDEPTSRHRVTDTGQQPKDWQSYREWRARDEPGWHPDPEASGAHTAGRSVTELLAAHGNQEPTSRHRRRAD